MRSIIITTAICAVLGWALGEFVAQIVKLDQQREDRVLSDFTTACEAVGGLVAWDKRQLQCMRK